MPDSGPEHLSFVDQAWLRMDRPYNHMTICAVMILADRLNLEQLQEHLQTTWLTYKRFKQRPVYHATGAYWETDTHFEIGNHVRRVGLPGAQGKEELEEFISNLVSTPLDPTKPLWDWHLVEDYRGGSAAIMRSHHCYADGIAMMHVLLTVTNKAPGVATTAARHHAHGAAVYRDEEESRGDIFRRLFDPVSEAISNALKTGRDLVEEGVDIVLHPSETVGYARQGMGLVWGYARQGLGFASETARLLLLADDPQTRFRGKLGAAKRVAWAEPLPLPEVKTLGKALGYTVNDVLLSSVAGALRAYLVAKGDVVDSQLEIRAAVPVNLRSWEQAQNLGNAFGLVFLTLPIGIENPLERLYKVHKHMEELKGSYQAMLMFGLLEILGLGPKIAQASAIRMLTKKATAVMTNVPGPQEPLYFAGCEIAELMSWVPQSGSIGVGVSIQSYNNRVHFGLITDQKLVKDPEAIVSQFSREFEKIVLLTLLGAWEKGLNTG